jgi:hypothetical protein
MVSFLLYLIVRGNNDPVTIKHIAIFDKYLDHGWSMVKLSASRMVSPKSVIRGESMQLAHILLAPSISNSINVVTDIYTQDDLHVYEL